MNAQETKVARAVEGGNGRRVGVDIGGTFTDFFVVDPDGTLTVHKEESNREQPLEAVIRGLEAIAAAGHGSTHEFVGTIGRFIHGTTSATNSVITQRGPRVGVVCTEGFRDVLGMRDGYKPDRFNIHLSPIEPFVPRVRTVPVCERMDYSGNPVVPLEPECVTAAATRLKELGVESVAVALLWSPMNPAHEREVAKGLRAELAEVDIVISSDVLPIIREWERTCATVLSAFVRPILASYMVELEHFLRSEGLRHDLLVMQINGGVASVDELLKRPVNAIHSGPAAGPAAGKELARHHGVDDFVVIDMGGTSFDVSLVNRGEPSITQDLRVADMPLGVQALDVHSIGAGGGSIALVDPGGVLHVGPQSAGADPGPACYGRGGTVPTVTDANLWLGYIDAAYFLGGRMKLDLGRAEAALQEFVASRLGLDVDAAAAGVIDVVNMAMAGAIRAMTIERGIDPREYLMVVGGGAGPLHAAALADELGLTSILVPQHAGVLCALGMVVADMRQDYVHPSPVAAQDFDPAMINKVYADLEERAAADFRAQGADPSDLTLLRTVDAKYVNQVHEITIPVPTGQLDSTSGEAILETFHESHRALYTYAIEDAEVAYYHWRLTAVLANRGEDGTQAPGYGERRSARPSGGRRIVSRNGGEPSRIEVATYRAEDLVPGDQIEGPGIVDAPTTTILVPSGWELETSVTHSYTLTRSQ